MSTYTAVLDNSKTNVEGHSKFLNRLFGAGVPSTFSATSLQVVQRALGANMSVDVSIGDAHLERPTGDYSFWSWQDAITNVVITAADATNPRIDAIVAWVDTSVTTTASNNSPGSLKFSAIPGTPAGSPSAPLDAAIQTELGSTVAWTRLANVTVGAAVTSIVTANISDARTGIGLRITLGAGAISSASMFSTALNPETRHSESFFDHVASGCVWSGDSYGSTRAASMTAGVVYVGGKRFAINAVSARTFTASTDTYIDINTSGSLVYTEVANNATSPSLTTNYLRIGIIVTGASNIANAGSVNQGQEDKVLPIASSIPYTVTDSLGNLICPRDPARRVLGYRQITSNFSSPGSGTPTQITGLTVPVIVPANRKIRVSCWCYGLNAGTANNYAIISLWDGTTGSGTQVSDARIVSTTGGYAYQAESKRVLSGVSGSKTYNASVTGSGAPSVTTIQALAVAPAFIMVELV